MTHTIMSIDAVHHCPSVRFKLVEKAMMHFAQNLHEDDLDKMDDCLRMIRFGMNNTVLTFQDECHENDGNPNQRERGLTVGACESAWLTDSVGEHTLSQTRDSMQQA